MKRRTKAVSQLFNSYTTYDEKLGQTQDVLVTEISHDKKHYVGHNKCYDQVLIPMEKRYLGKMVRVKIFETGKHFLKGDPLPGQFDEDWVGQGVDLDPAWPLASPGKISTRDGDFGEDEECCGDCGKENGVGCGKESGEGDCGSGGSGCADGKPNGGSGDCGGGNCDEGDACCKNSSATSASVIAPGVGAVDKVDTRTEEPAHFVNKVISEREKRDLPYWFKLSVIAVVSAVFFRAIEVIL